MAKNNLMGFYDYLKEREQNLEDKIEKGEDRMDVDYSDLQYQRGRAAEAGLLKSKFEKFIKSYTGEEQKEKVVEAFELAEDSDEDPLTLGEITKISGLPRDIVEGFLVDLEQEGKVEVAEKKGRAKLWRRDTDE